MHRSSILVWLSIPLLAACAVPAAQKPTTAQAADAARYLDFVEQTPAATSGRARGLADTVNRLADAHRALQRTGTIQTQNRRIVVARQSLKDDSPRSGS